MVAFKNLVRSRKRQDDQDPYAGIPGIRHLTRGEGQIHFDQQAHQLLGISSEEFLLRWDAGEYQPVPDTVEGRKLGTL